MEQNFKCYVFNDREFISKGVMAYELREVFGADFGLSRY